MKKIGLFYLLLIFPMMLLAQTREITGKVLDENRQPLPGASVVAKGLAVGSSTDFDGNFTIQVPENVKILVVSYVGYGTKEITLTSQNSYEIQLQVDTNILDEVVIVGYGTIQRRDVTASISKITESSEVAGQYTSASEMLQGRAAGVQVTSNTGAPGAPTSVRIRGGSSLRGNNEPLYVIDGVIISSAGEDVANATQDGNEIQQTQNGLTGLNMRDVESMQILKDAAATAIYGSRGANGVVLITTKRGRLGKGVFNVYSSSSISQVSKKIKVLDPINFARYRNHAAIIGGNNISYQIDGGNVYLIQDGEPSEQPLRIINWQDEVFQEGYSTNAGLNLSGASEKANYYLSGDFNKLQGNVPNTFLNSGNFRINYGTRVSDKLKVNSRVGLYLSEGSMNQGASKSGGQRSFIRNLVSYNPLVDGELEDDEIGVSNPFTFLDGFEETIKEKRINASIDVTYEIAKGLKYQLRAGTDYRNKYRSRWYGPETFKGAQTNGDLSISTLEKISYTIDNLLMFNKTFNKKHRINTVLGITYDGSDAYSTTVEVGSFPINTLRELNPQLGELVISPFASVGPIEERILSFLGRANYTLDDKYVFSGSFRVDQSSKFREGNRAGLFPAFSFAWIAGNEDFLEDSNTISNLKLRASWGKVGNQAINAYQTYSNYGDVLYSDGNNSTVLGAAALNIANSDLTWEKTSQINAGVDISFF